MPYGLWPTGGNSRSLCSLKCGRNLRFPHKRPLPDRFRKGFPGIAKVLLTARRGSPHKRPSLAGST